MPLILLFFWLCLSIAQAQILRDEAMGADQGVKIRRITYRSDSLLVKGLLFVPPIPAGEKRPLVIFSHDGIRGISSQHRLASLRLARAGYVVFSPSYRGEDGSQGQIEVAKGEVDDVLAAVAMLQRVPEADGQRLALAGASHGALISMLAAPRLPQTKAVVAAYGVMDIYQWWDYLNRSGKRGRDAVTLRTYGEGPQARPESFAIRHALSVVPTLSCPVLVLQGKKDDIVPYQQALLLQQAMEKAGKSCQVELYPDCLHGFLVYAPYLQGVSSAERRQTEQSWKTLLAFLKKTL